MKAKGVRDTMLSCTAGEMLRRYNRVGCNAVSYCGWARAQRCRDAGRLALCTDSGDARPPTGFWTTKVGLLAWSRVSAVEYRLQNSRGCEGWQVSLKVNPSMGLIFFDILLVSPYL